MDVVVGVDAGGSRTRAICVDLDGSLLGRGDAAGGSPWHNADARANIRAAIDSALDHAKHSRADVAALAAGIAGYDQPADAEWADEFIAMPGVDGVRIAVNDTEVAHAGAFGGGPGIIAIAGTGSLIFGITETGEKVNNGQFMHYAGGARHLVFDTVQQLLLDSRPEDLDLMNAALSHWNAADTTSLRAAVLADTGGDNDEMKRHFGAFAPTVTSQVHHSPLASAALERLVGSTRVGIELLALGFTNPTVPVALEGGLACSEQFTDALASAFRSAGSRCELVAAQSTPVNGAAMLARAALA